MVRKVSGSKPPHQTIASRWSRRPSLPPSKSAYLDPGGEDRLPDGHGASRFRPVDGVSCGGVTSRRPRDLLGERRDIEVDLLAAHDRDPQRAGQDGADRVGHALPRDVRRRSVDGLEHAREAALGVEVGAGGVAQAAGQRRAQQLGLLAVMLLTSKGAAGVAGGGFIALTATRSTLGTVPAAGIMLVFGIDKFMSECRALVNFYGNAVAALVIAKWGNALDIDRARAVLATHTAPELCGGTVPETNESAAAVASQAADVTGRDRQGSLVTQAR
jgi:Sodium:dicarboxylate symporter family